MQVNIEIVYLTRAAARRIVLDLVGSRNGGSNGRGIGVMIYSRQKQCVGFREFANIVQVPGFNG